MGLEHGTRSAYNHLKCRCEPCTTANREYIRGRIGFSVHEKIGSLNSVEFWARVDEETASRLGSRRSPVHGHLLSYIRGLVR